MGYLAVKVCILGDSNVGKSCIAVRFVDNTFGVQLPNTIGASFNWKVVQTSNGTLYKLQIWDTVGQERYRALAPLYYRGAGVVLLVFDVTDRETFADGLQTWVEQLNEHCNSDELLLVLIGNKVDLGFLRQVDKDEAREFADTIGAIYWETSAKTGLNVDEVFASICSELEQRGNKHLTYEPDPSSVRQRTITVTSSTGDNVEPRHLRITSRCCNL